MLLSKSSEPQRDVVFWAWQLFPAALLRARISGVVHCNEEPLKQLGRKPTLNPKP